LPSSTATRLRLALTPPQALSHTSAVQWGPPVPSAAPGVVLAHGAGTDLTSSLLCAAGRGLAERGHPVLTFNFAYSEAGSRRPDPPARLEQAMRDAAGLAREQMGDRPLVLGGRSMGGRIASQVAAQGEPCDGLLLLGYPLHPAGKPEQLRTAHWPQLRVPALFVHGDRDRLCDLELFERERAARLAGCPTEVHVIAGADHAFGVRKRDGRAPTDALDEAVEVAAGWLHRAFGGADTGALAS
jgi:uncharacterized protein